MWQANDRNLCCYQPKHTAAGPHDWRFCVWTAPWKLWFRERRHRKSLDRSPFKKPLEDGWTNLLPVALKAANWICLVSVPFLRTITPVTESKCVSQRLFPPLAAWKVQDQTNPPSPPLSHSLTQFASWKASSLHSSQTGRAVWTVPRRIINKASNTTSTSLPSLEPLEHERSVPTAALWPAL